jgi:hypothetical protein
MAASRIGALVPCRSILSSVSGEEESAAAISRPELLQAVEVIGPEDHDRIVAVNGDPLRSTLLRAAHDLARPRLCVLETPAVACELGGLIA